MGENSLQTNSQLRTHFYGSVFRSYWIGRKNTEISPTISVKQVCGLFVGKVEFFKKISNKARNSGERLGSPVCDFHLYKLVRNMLSRRSHGPIASSLVNLLYSLGKINENQRSVQLRFTFSTFQYPLQFSFFGFVSLNPIPLCSTSKNFLLSQVQGSLLSSKGEQCHWLSSDAFRVNSFTSDGNWGPLQNSFKKKF